MANQQAGTGKALRLIKKYPNRRLYDTQTSTYITLADVKLLVLENAEFQVIDAKSTEDLTRSILLQIILEEETAGVPMFTAPMLSQVIRFYGHAMQGSMGASLEKNVQMFSDFQARMVEQGATPEMWNQFVRLQPSLMQGMVGNYLGQSQTMFTQMQEQMQKQTEQMLEAMGLKR